MSEPVRGTEERILVLAPNADDASLTAHVMREARLACRICANIDDLLVAMNEGAAAIVMTDDVMSAGDPRRIVEALQRQPEWSDIPILLLAGGGAESPAAHWLMNTLGNVTALDRPVHIIPLVSALRSAIRARRRQYQVRDQLRTIRAAQESLRDESRRKDEFLAILAHELRNPLAPITTALHLLRHPGISPAETKSAFDMMARQVTHMVRLVDDLLDLSRISRGIIELRLEELDLGAVMSAAIESARPLIESGRHTLVEDLPASPILIEADGVRLSQVVTNLLNNAAKYTPPHGTITLSVRIHQQGSTGEAEICVADTGAGIPREMLSRIFEMFTQVDQARRNAQGGLGIGLTLVKSLVEMHGGRVVARSEGAGRGSEFSVHLPLRQRGARIRERALATIDAR